MRRVYWLWYSPTHIKKAMVLARYGRYKSK